MLDTTENPGAAEDATSAQPAVTPLLVALNPKASASVFRARKESTRLPLGAALVLTARQENTPLLMVPPAAALAELVLLASTASGGVPPPAQAVLPAKHRVLVLLAILLAPHAMTVNTSALVHVSIVLQANSRENQHQAPPLVLLVQLTRTPLILVKVPVMRVKWVDILLGLVKLIALVATLENTHLLISLKLVKTVP